MSTFKPGIYPSLSSEEYFADPCPVPSLTQSIAKILLAKSPAHAALSHPRLNPNYAKREYKADRDRDLGSAFHSMFLDRGREIHVVMADDWRTKDARAERDGAAASGKLPILEKDYAVVQAAIDAAATQLVDRGFGPAFDLGSPETAVICSVGPDWFRSLIDWYTPTRIFDYKLTGMSAAPEDVGRKMFADGWPIQAAMHEFILNRLDPDTAGRREHLFVVQENYEPYALTVVKVGESAMTWGRNRLARAIGIWSECMASGVWPAYPHEVVTPTPPPWMMTEGDA
jgi:hypothetical protein